LKNLNLEHLEHVAYELNAQRKTLVILGCSKEKLHHKAKAIEMYQGTLFKLGCKYAESIKADIVILSAKYGILYPDQVIKPYNEQMTFQKVEQFLNQITFRMELRKIFEKPYTSIQAFVGRLYLELLAPVWKVGCINFFGSDGLGGIGKVLHWLKENISVAQKFKKLEFPYHQF